MDEEKKPDLSELARDMLAWEQMRGMLEEIENKIRIAVLRLGKTQTVGTVRATYTGGRKTYDYKGAVYDHAKTVTDPDEQVKESAVWDRHGELEMVYDFKAICEELKIDAPFTQGSPSVTVKIIA